MSEMDENDWVEIEDEEHVLHYCWENLPLEISYDEFKSEMVKLKQHKNAKSNVLFGICQNLWRWSGYISTLWTVTKYRQIIMQLVAWYLFK